MTLRQALDLALQQNPDMVLARLDQQKARDQVTIEHDSVFAQSLRRERLGIDLRISHQHRRQRAVHRAGEDQHGAFRQAAELSGGAGE